MPDSIRLYVFLGVLIVFCLAEIFIPRRKRVYERGERAKRILSNLGLVFITNTLVKILIPLGPVALAYNLHEFDFAPTLLLKSGIGYWGNVIVSIIILDFFIWGQHLITHKLPLFWRFHRVHHFDEDLDFSSALRFHPIELIASLGFKCFLILLIGPLPLGVLLFEIILSSMAIFNHSNIYIPKGLDRLLKLVFVTPDMHRIHHSVKRIETNSNYGFNFSFWDRLFGTYTKMDFSKNNEIEIGLEEEKGRKTFSLIYLLSRPFRRP